MLNKIAFLGLIGTFPAAANHGQLLISLPEDKRARWSQLPDSYLKSGTIPRSCLGRLIGRLLFSQTSLFGKSARTQLRPPY